ncbi:hypothetical protein ACQP2F_15115 [Actinoplanes sp. CA-030573]|uniref:hypothetical protein n=1 Tax=Actinoplanes sp. CA-030573 TaxID=3239898 RepID=UPI003D8C65FE
MITYALRLRAAHDAGDVHVFTAMSTLKAIARRVHALEEEAAEHEKAIRKIVSAWRPDLLALTGVGPIVAATVLAAWSHAGRCATTRHLRCSRALRRSLLRRARRSVIASTVPATGS